MQQAYREMSAFRREVEGGTEAAPPKSPSLQESNQPTNAQRWKPSLPRRVVLGSRLASGGFVDQSRSRSPAAIRQQGDLTAPPPPPPLLSVKMQRGLSHHARSAKSPIPNEKLW